MNAVVDIVLALGVAVVIIALVGVMLSDPGRCRCQSCRDIRR